MEECVDRLALLQAQLNAAEIAIASDRIIDEYSTKIAELEKQLSEHRDALHDLVSVYGTDLIIEQIEEAKDAIIDKWTGEEKTMVFDAGTLKFTTRGSLKIKKDAVMLEDLCVRMQSYTEVMKYLKGFNLTAVKKYMGVHDLPIDVAEIEYKTTVKLEQKSG